MKSLLLILLFLASGTTYIAGQRLNHHPRINIQKDKQDAKSVHQTLKKQLPSPAPKKLNRPIVLKKHQPLGVHQVKAMKDPWSWIIFTLFFICLVSAVIAIVLGIVAPESVLLLIFTLIAVASFAAGMIALVIVLANQPPPPPASLLKD